MDDSKFTLLSWNVNGIRSLEKETKANKVNIFPMDADVICVQETKVNDQPHIVHVPGYQAHYSMPTKRKKIAYSGVATFVKESVEVKRVIRDEELLGRELGGEGRILIIILDALIIVNVYFVNDSEERRQYRTDFFHAVFAGIQKLHAEYKEEKIVLCGDLNVTPYAREHCLYSRSWVTFYDDDPLRACFRKLLDGEWVDCFRNKHPQREEAYTCWNTKLGTRASNYGTRIDYILLLKDSEDASFLLEAQIRPDVMGSDHCPVVCTFKYTCVISGETKKRPTITSFLQPIHSDTVEVDVAVVKKKPRTTRITTFFTPMPSTEPKSLFTASFDATEESSLLPELEQQSPPTKQEDWSSIFNKPQKTVLCKGHGEPCKLLQVQKKGPNHKRYFYLCARPIGKDNARCDHFEWLR